MGYACPVCEDPQADDRHLANHLAFTAMLRRGDHETWLDEHVDGWRDAGEAELAERVAPLAAETEFPQVFEDTAGGLDEDRSSHGHEHQHGHGHQHGHDDGFDEAAARSSAPDAPADDETQRILEEARELTRRRREGESADGDEREGDDATGTEAADDESGETDAADDRSGGNGNA